MALAAAEPAPGRPPADERSLRDWLRTHVVGEVAARAPALDAAPAGADAGEIRALYARTGLFELAVPRDAGRPAGARLAAICVEEIAAACGGCALLLMLQRLAALPIALAGTPDQREFLPRLAAGELVGAFALTEAGAGSDASRLATRAVVDGDGWRIAGEKVWISNAPDADVFVVFAVTDPAAGARGVTAFIVPRDAHGVEVGPRDAKMGVRAAPTAAVRFDDVFVGADAVLGEPGRGLRLALGTLDLSRLGVAAQATGLAQGAIDAAIAHGHSRQQFGAPLWANQGFAFPLARLAAQTAAARELMLAACDRADAGDPQAGRYASMAKLVCSETAVAATQAAIHALGSAGYTQGALVDRLARDARVTTIYEGTSEVQLTVLARALRAPDG
jgi:alkylation response protein AidB-like acyl-CoA dehydrogenase